ncbi:MAG TPA: hypothetical protein VH592_22020 [Gemmataceae bacterium]|jgi:hypothetical protein
MLPDTITRVPLHTPQRSNEAIRQQTEENIADTALGGQEAIERRLRELDREWDMERALETNASIVALIGLGLGAFVDRRFNVLPAVVCGFLLQHALQGWCPPVPLFRRLGVRTASEIDYERYALKALRGDFRSLSETNGRRNSPYEAIAAAES